MITFQNSQLLWLLLMPVLHLLALLIAFNIKEQEFGATFSKEVLAKIRLKKSGLSKKWRILFLLLAISFAIVSFARPQIDNGEIEVKSSFINVVTAIDMSKSMFANDVYPNRFEFAKKKFFDSLSFFKNSKIALMGFSSQTFLISPLTQDFHSLKFLGKNLNLEYLNLKGTDIMVTLESANDLFGDEKKKILLMFTDGSDQKEFSKEIAYCKENNIVIYIYNIGTDKGGIIKNKEGVLKDKDDNIVVVKRTDNIKALALQTGGAYMKYSLANDDIKLLADTIQKSYDAKKEENSTIKDRRELFYYPLALALLFWMMSLFSFPQRKQGAKA